MDAKLVLINDKDKATVIKLKKLPMTVGRGREADLTIPHPMVSRLHCELYAVEETLCVRDTGSLNGTYVDDARVEEAALENGDVLTVGSAKFKVVLASEGANEEEMAIAEPEPEAETADLEPPAARSAKPAAGESVIDLEEFAAVDEAFSEIQPAVPAEKEPETAEPDEPDAIKEAEFIPEALEDSGEIAELDELEAVEIREPEKPAPDPPKPKPKPGAKPPAPAKPDKSKQKEAEKPAPAKAKPPAEVKEPAKPEPPAETMPAKKEEPKPEQPATTTKKEKKKKKDALAETIGLDLPDAQTKKIDTDDENLGDFLAGLE